MAGDLPSWAVPVDESKPVAGLPEWAKLAPEPSPVLGAGAPSTPAERGPSTPQPTPDATPGVVDHAIDVAKGFLPPSSGPLGALLNALSGGKYGTIAPRYGGLYPAPS